MVIVWSAVVLLGLSVHAGAISIDGRFGDWESASPITVGRYSESMGDGTPDGNDIAAVWMASDDESLFLCVRCVGPIRGLIWSPIFVAMDLDRDPSTGYPSRPLGVDCLVQPRSDLSGVLMVQRRIAGANDGTWSKWDGVNLEGGCAVGTGSECNRLEMRIPWKALGISDSSKATFRFRICDNSDYLNPANGDWAPEIDYFGFGKDSGAMEQAKNLCANGDFEQIQTAAGKFLPQDWQDARGGAGGTVSLSEDSAQGKYSLRLQAGGAGAAGMNSAVMDTGRGIATLRYKVLKSDVDGANLALFVIGLSDGQGTEVKRIAYSPPKEYVSDGQWHDAVIDFDFSDARVRHCIVAPRVNESVARTGEGEWLIDSVEVYAAPVETRVKPVRLWSDKPLAKTGDAIRFSAFVESTGDDDATDVSVTLKASANVSIIEPAKRVPSIAIGSYRRVDWTLTALKPGPVQLEVTSSVKSGSEVVSEAASYKILVIDRNAKYTRQELCTDADGYWRLLEKPATLQQGNAGTLSPIKHLTSSEIKRNTYGICAHLPRAKDYEDPFNPSHLIDGDPESCWSSQQNPSPYPGITPWAEIDLGRQATIKQINLIPYWANTDFPVGFSVRTSLDGKTWQTAIDETDYHLKETNDKRADKFAQSFALNKPVKTRRVRIEFERLPLSGGNYAEVSQGYKARLSGIEVIDENGGNVALLDKGASVKAINFFTGWQNTAKTVNESFGRIFDIGLKWVRVSQWGDQTEWAAVEREKGKFRIDPATDAGIRKLLDNGVDILYTLDYGNALYESINGDKPFGDMGPIYTEGHPFYRNNGPRTEEGRQAFVRYVDLVVRKYGDRIKWWELWNEENGWYPGHEPELYGKLLYAVAKHIKEIDPDLNVMFGGTAAPAPLTTEIALREGAAPYVDAYAFHPYGIDKPEGGMGTMEFHQGKNLSQSREQTGWNHLEEIVEGVKKPFAQHGKPNVEVWLNEWGTNISGLDFTYKPGIGEYGCAKYMTRFFIYSGWLNLPAAWWALYNENKSQDWGIIDQTDYSLRPMSYATQNVCSVVSDVEPIRKLDYTYEGQAPDPKVIGYTKDGSGDKLVLVWGADTFTDDVRSYPSKLTFELKSEPKQVTLTDLYWGVSQPAVWTYDAGKLTISDLIVRDYPIVITCRR